MKNFEKVNPKQSFPKLEEKILNFWQENNIFEESINIRKDAEEFNFYDGPPFATGTPHYGHILAGTLKDVIPRYQTMKGKRVERVFGWDCHGLPIENIVEKKLEISGRDDILKIGVHTFNEECRSNVLTYTDEWKKTVNRMGRWVDIDNAYKTMDTSFMESVWWVYKELYNKGLIYEGHRVVPYCPRCTTPLSNFEVNQGYKDKQDKTLTVKFKVIGNESKYILAWTTTPWTLIANLGLAVGADIMYSEIRDSKTGETYVLASERLKDYYKNDEEYTLLREYKGSCLEGIKYQPVFDDFQVQINDMGKDLGTNNILGKNAYTVVLGHHVTTESGTGVVHIAPAYGEDDFLIGKNSDLGFISHIDDSGKTTDTLDDDGKYVFDYNTEVIDKLKERGDILKISTIDHSYPHCWRCDTPLIYRGISAWYVAVEKIRDKMVANNQKINWTPDIIKNGRFGKWVENARDWNISRNRYWGSAIPVWQSEDKKEEVCIGSVKEMYELNKEFGQIKEENGKYFYTNTNQEVDIHKHFVDEIYLENKDNFKAKNVLGVHGFKRTNEVVDFLEKTGVNIKDHGINYVNPEFEVGDNVSYKNWSKKFDELNLGNFDTIIAHSMGCRAVIEYIAENKIHLERLVLVSPAIKGSGRTEITQFYSEMKHDLSEINALVKEIIIVSSIDDTIVRFEEAKELSEILKSSFIEVNGYGHFNIKEIKLLEGLVKTGTPLKRIPEVLDCWFESGAMPYASKHFPFENSDNFKFPADFIAEGIDQTRGWFYTLLILGTALFDNTPFLNVIVNGTVLAEDGHKMSKSKKNYPDPHLIFDKYGADAMRFYLMNSPVVEAQDFRFAESGVEEVVKKVILPLWNTYYFFTTYANIDNFKPKEGNIYFVRHGETDNNKNRIVNGGNDDVDINETGIEQAHETGRRLKELGINIDKIVSSPMLRATHTAEIIKQYLGENLEIEIKEGLREMDYGESKGKKFINIGIENNIGEDSLKIRDYIIENSSETLDNFRHRVQESYNQIEEENKGKNVIFIGHSGNFRALRANKLNINTIREFHDNPTPKNSTIINLTREKNNNLDKWLISELNELTKEVSNGFDTYKLNEAAKPIVKFMDNLTNWYIRRSRKRFWKSENDGDKIEAYETLYYTLVELTKIIAPFMPFISEHMYKELTGEKSVHLTNFPTYDSSLIDEKLNADTDKVQKIITLGLAWRANQKIRVRQPLKSITITEKLDNYYVEIIKEELNVKEVLVVDGNTLAKQICKPNGRAIGPKFGGDVKYIMSEAKSGNFEVLDNGNVKISRDGNLSHLEEFILEEGDFELVFESGNEGLLIEAGFGMVIAMDNNITEDLKLEGYARDLVRHIQEARKEADYNVDDRIKVNISGLEEVIILFKNNIETETLSSIIEDIGTADLSKEIDIEGLNIILKLKK